MGDPVYLACIPSFQSLVIMDGPPFTPGFTFFFKKNDRLNRNQWMSFGFGPH